MAWEDVSRTHFEEKMLWLCVLKRAIFDFVLYKGSGKHRIKWTKANQYLFDNGPELDNTPTFSEVCSLFGWEPDYIRRLTRRLTREDLKKIETNKFRDEFFDSDTPIIQALRWRAGNAPVPFFPPYNYVAELREQLTLRPVPLQQRHMSLLRPTWQAVAA